MSALCEHFSVQFAFVRGPLSVVRCRIPGRERIFRLFLAASNILRVRNRLSVGNAVARITNVGPDTFV